MMNKINEDVFLKLKETYPWLQVNEKVEDYLEPEYYNDILKEYIFSGKSDLEIFLNFLDKCSSAESILELGCGSGRVTDVCLDFFRDKPDKKIEILDLSAKMLDYCKTKYSRSDIKYINSDTYKHMETCDQKYDLVYSLWSYSHSIHQIIPMKGNEIGEEYVSKVLEKFINNNINKFGRMFIIHFDTKSEEQTILIDQWKKIYNMFSDTSKQSPSLLITDSVLKRLKDSGIIDYNLTHLIGDEIIYESENDALETFLNFHMESEFNELEILPNVINDLKEYFSRYKMVDGKIAIKPGCFIIEIQKKK